MPPLELVDLKRQYAVIGAELQAALDDVIQKSDFILGEAVTRFERHFARFVGTQHAVGVASGTAAIWLILRALGIGPGDEVITVANTFIATVEPVVLVGARPVFVDIDPHTYTIDPRRIEAAITPRTRAILPVHLFGQCADMTAIMEIARRHDLVVVEDAAQAHGARHGERLAGSMGIAGAFSFYPGKNLGAFGDAGAVTTHDEALAARIERLRNHGRSQKHVHQEIGSGERLDSLQAAVLDVKLNYLDRWNAARRHWAGRYSELLRDVPGITIPTVGPAATHVFHLYVIRCPRRDALQAFLHERGIRTGIHYPLPLHRQPALQNVAFTAHDLTATEQAAGELLSLPMFPELTDEDVQYVAATIREFVTQR